VWLEGRSIGVDKGVELGGWAIANMAGTSPMPKTHVVLAFEALLPVIINYMCTGKKVCKSTRWIGLAVTSYIFDNCRPIF
jgi:hypothetical protein